MTVSWLLVGRSWRIPVSARGVCGVHCAGTIRSALSNHECNVCSSLCCRPLYPRLQGAARWSRLCIPCVSVIRFSNQLCVGWPSIWWITRWVVLPVILHLWRSLSRHFFLREGVSVLGILLRFTRPLNRLGASRVFWITSSDDFIVPPQSGQTIRAF